MRIVQLANFVTLTSGGLRTTLEHLGAGYREAGHDRVLVVPGITWWEERADGDLRIEVPGRAFRGLDPYLVITDIAAVAARLDELHPDVLEVSDKLTLHRLSGWARRRGVGMVLLSHERLDGHLAPRVPRVVPLARLADTFNRRLAERFDVIACASRYAAEEFTRIGVATVPVRLGVDLDVFRPRPPMSVAVDAENPVVVWSGRMSKEKRPEIAADTFAVLAQRGVPMRGLMVGDGPMRPQLEARLAGPGVVFAGHIADRTELASVLARCDVALNTCPAETFGLTVLEALACGLPSVVANRGGAGELIAGGCGLTTYLHAEAFASAVTDVLGWPHGERRRAARARAEQFPWSATVDTMLAIHADDVVSATRRRRTLVR